MEKIYLTSLDYKILILGASGMLGSSILRYFYNRKGWHVWGTIRGNLNPDSKIIGACGRNIIPHVNLSDFKSVEHAVLSVKPDLVINCIGVIKQKRTAVDVISMIDANSLFPHRIAALCETIGARFLTVGTDCVFSGLKGSYIESDPTDAEDFYGRSKFLGEVSYANSLTLRTSIIGHELNSSVSLIDWFLAQTNKVNGYTKAVFSGVPTIYFAEIIEKYVVPNSNMRGLYHLSVEPITKYNLLTLVSDVYKKNIEITPHNEYEIDRSLDSTKFRTEFSFQPLSWVELVKKMHQDFLIMRSVNV